MRIEAAELETEIIRVLTGNGASAAQAGSAASHMAWCESVGRHNFGIERIPIHLKRIQAGVLDPAATPAIGIAGPSLLRVDGGNGFGYHAASYAMEQCIGRARATGIGIAGVRNSNFFGAGAYYVNMAAAAGMIGLAMSNSFPKVVPHGGLKPVLGTNPFAFGAPRRNGDHLLFDMATSALAGSTVREHIEKGKALPEGLAIDAEGRPITDPNKAGAGALLPFGGAKGYGLSLLVEILAGVLTSAGVSDGVASMYNDFGRGGGNGHFVMALDVARFMTIDEYFQRFEGLVALLKGSGGQVLLPGEIRWETYRDSQRRGIDVDSARWTAMRALG